MSSLSSAEVIVFGATCLYAVVFSVFGIAHYWSFGYSRLDLGDMTQAIWTTAHGHFLETTTDTGQQFSRLGVHTDVFLILFVPIWLVWSSPVVLVVFQAVAVSAGALPVFWLARKHLLSKRAAVFFTLAYLLFIPTQYNAFAPMTGFHSVSIAIPLLLFGIWFLDEERLVAFAIVGLLAATTKEEIPFAVGLLGIWFGARSGRWRVGLSIFGLGFLAGLLNFLVIIPHYDHGTSFFSGRYAAVGGSPGGIVRTALTHPITIVQDLATAHKLVYLAVLLLPFLGLWVLEPLLFLCAVPDLMINLLSSTPAQTSVMFHYTAGIVPFVVAGSILGAARWKRQSRRLSIYVFAAVVGLSVVSPLRDQNISGAFAANPVRSAKVHALSLIPSGVPVSASTHLAGYLANRRRLMNFPVIREARWIVVDDTDPLYADLAEFRRDIRKVRNSSNWRLVYSSHGVTVFHKVAGAGG